MDYINRLFPIIVLIVLFYSGCNSNKNKTQQIEHLSSTKTDEFFFVDRFPELEEGEIDLDESCFGEITELKGEQKITNEMYSISIQLVLNHFFNK